MKLQDYELRRLGQQMVDFHDDIRDLANNGKYAHPIVSAVPAWKADNGEMAFYDGVAGGGLPGKRIYVRLSSAWSVFATSPFSGIPGGTESSVQFNSSNAFGGDEIIKWFQTSSALVISPSSTGTVTPLILVNSQAVASANTNSNIDFKFQFATTDAALIEVGKEDDFTSAAKQIAFMSFNVATAGTLVQIARLNQYGLAVGDTGQNTQAVVLKVGPGLDGTTVTKGLVLVNGAGYIPYAAVNYYGGLILGDYFTGIPNYGITLRSRTTNKTGGIATAELLLDGQPGSQITFADGGTAGGTPAGQVGSICALLGHFVTAGVSEARIFSLTKPNRVLLTGFEEPLMLFGKTALANANNSLTTNQNYNTQRQVIFYPQTINGSGALSSVSYAATVFIEGPPIATNSMNLMNRYALWVGTGPVRIDGDVILGAAQTPTKSGGAFFTTTVTGVASNNASEITLIRGVIGTTSLVANTLSDGRTLRLQAWGYYNTPLVADNLTMNVKLGGTTVLTTGAQTPASSVSTGGWHLNALITCLTTGGAGTIMSQGEFPHQSTAILEVNWQMVNSSNVTLNTTGANVVEITAQWGGASSASQLFMTNCTGELLN